MSFISRKIISISRLPGITSPCMSTISRSMRSSSLTNDLISRKTISISRQTMSISRQMMSISRQTMCISRSGKCISRVR
ncbi:hypothetical protein [uncultured Carboxylicivirga sp.]|uniref:hypothetical protein n=1 Tax=uncultured Carboxylicivirga sp. TaxID=1628156 RepID=UPI002599038A|nr:hypothetical protein [uncultured Carboxylicivirga sp.]